MHIDKANGVAEYVVRGEEGEIPARTVYSPEGRCLSAPAKETREAGPALGDGA